jgi:hypothetical protein
MMVWGRALPTPANAVIGAAVSAGPAITPRLVIEVETVRAMVTSLVVRVG